jgi:tetratricopeptide (TPR) repeat protein
MLYRPLVLRLLAAVALAGLILVAYGRALRSDFVFDDHALVVGNPILGRPLSSFTGLVRRGAPGTYRPLRVLSYLADARVAGGLDPAILHASNLAYHLAVTLALCSLALAMGAPSDAALVAGATFAVHPLGTETVAYVSGRRDLLCALFVLLALRSWWSFATRRAAYPAAAATLLGSALFAALALAAKETAIVTPVLALLLWLTAVRRGVLAALLAVVACVLYPERLHDVTARMLGPGLAPQPALTLVVLGKYLSLALWPAILSADYRSGAFPLPLHAIDVSSAATAVTLAALAAFGGWLLWRGAIAGAGILWFLVALLPVAQLVPYREVVAEHNAYLPLAGLALAVGEAVSMAARRWGRTVYVAAALVLALATARTSRRVADWHDDLTLWSSTIAVAPRSARAHFNLGTSLAAHGRLPAARAQLEQALELEPRNREIQIAMASVCARLGDYRRAVALASSAVDEQRDARALTLLGWAQLGDGDADLAARSFTEALELDPGSTDATQGRRRAQEGARSVPKDASAVDREQRRESFVGRLGAPDQPMVRSDRSDRAEP